MVTLRLQIAGGILKGAMVPFVETPQVRPTLLRVRQAACDIWQDLLPGSVFIDAFAGSGLMGLEAWSRGAERVIAIEQHRRTARQLEQTVARLGQERGCLPELRHAWSVRTGPLEQVVPRLADEGVRADLIYCDPPYGYPGLAALPRLLLDSLLLAPWGEVLLECAERDQQSLPPGLHGRIYRYGGTLLVRLKKPE